MTIIDMIASFFMGALSGMGIGGGGLLVIYLTLVRGTDQISAQGLNLYFFLFASAAALFVHCTKRRINYPLVLILAAFGMPMSFAGSLAASAARPETVRVIFGVMLIIAGGISLIRALCAYLRNKKL
ncbi:MAG: sulfite exporter TauE/SafE family protein [Ruminococcaceae bacterium]|nr:sulfite exporter TauE/SafE family protein [Oscillospiraceae bacterium]